jgi:hypothetical protein
LVLALGELAERQVYSAQAISEKSQRDDEKSELSEIDHGENAGQEHLGEHGSESNSENREQQLPTFH